MVREAEVEAAAVDLELGAEVLLRHRRALDVPARASGPPGRVPLRVLVRLRRLPEGEVAGVFLQVARLLGDHVVRLRARERAVRGIGRHAEVDVAAGLVGEPAVDQLADESDYLRDDLGRARLDVWPAEPELVGVVDVPLRRLLGQLGAPHLLPRGRLVDLVIDVRDVLDELDLVARARRATGASTSRRRTDARFRCGSAGTRSGRRRTCGSGPAEPGARPSAAWTSRRAAPRRYTGLPVSSC